MRLSIWRECSICGVPDYISLYSIFYSNINIYLAPSHILHHPYARQHFLLVKTLLLWPFPFATAPTIAPFSFSPFNAIDCNSFKSVEISCMSPSAKLLLKSSRMTIHRSVTCSASEAILYVGTTKLNLLRCFELSCSLYLKLLLARECG